MNVDQTNPCSHEWFVYLLSWAETTCWCCTTFRAAFVFLPLGVVIGMVFVGEPLAALITFCIAAPIVFMALRIARTFWKDDSEEGGNGAES